MSTYTAEALDGTRIITAADTELECLTACQEHFTANPKCMGVRIEECSGRSCRGMVANRREVKTWIRERKRYDALQARARELAQFETGR